jgi:hypothetical protein
MWQHGVPAGFCDKPAYGHEEKGQTRYEGYVPALACYDHGGPQAPPPACPRCARLEEENEKLKAALVLIDGGDNPSHDESQLRQWAYEAVTLGRDFRPPAGQRKGIDDEP